MESAHKLLVASKNFEVTSSSELVELSVGSGNRTIIGDFYGDPEVAVIDSDEEWVAMAGCGLIVYFLRPPFTPYEYHCISPQWAESWRYAPDIEWISAIHQTGPSEITVVLDEGGSVVVTVDSAMRRLHARR